MSEQQDEIRSVIAFYDEWGWDWLSIVAYLAAVSIGMWPMKGGWRR